MRDSDDQLDTKDMKGTDSDNDDVNDDNDDIDVIDVNDDTFVPILVVLLMSAVLCLSTSQRARTQQPDPQTRAIGGWKPAWSRGNQRLRRWKRQIRDRLAHWGTRMMRKRKKKRRKMLPLPLPLRII